MNTALISRMLKDGRRFVPCQAVDAIKSQQRQWQWRRWRRFWLSLRAHAVMSVMRSPAGKVARFNRGLAKRFLRGCDINGATSQHRRHVNNVTDRGCQSFVTRTLATMKGLAVDVRQMTITLTVWQRYRLRRNANANRNEIRKTNVTRAADN